MKLLTVEQVAETLAVSTKTVGRILANGQLAGHNVSANSDSKKPRMRVHEDDLMAFLEKRRQAPQQTRTPQNRRRRRK